jgi:anthranilate synthase
VQYLQQLQADTTVLRNDEVTPWQAAEYDGVLLSPGPGTPEEAGACVDIVKEAGGQIPIFGVCLGLQALAEAYGGELRHLAIPMHGKPSRIRVLEPGIVFSGLGKEVTVGRYHSIFADPATLAREFIITAESEDGTIMGIEHTREPVAAVQFHPESIMTLGSDAGMRMIENVVAHLAKRAKVKAA